MGGSSPTLTEESAKSEDWLLKSSYPHLTAPSQMAKKNNDVGSGNRDDWPGDLQARPPEHRLVPAKRSVCPSPSTLVCPSSHRVTLVGPVFKLLDSFCRSRNERQYPKKSVAWINYNLFPSEIKSRGISFQDFNSELA